MADTKAGGSWILFGTIFVSMVLAIVSLPEFVPDELGYLRPEWVPLVLIYWIIALPQRIGIVAAWMVGLMMDVLMGSLLGQHAIAYILMAYVTYSLYQRLRMFAIWQQSLVVFAIVGLNQLINFWIENIAGVADWTLWYLLPSLMSALVWPWVFLLLRFLRRTFHVT
ncbi:MAG: rod shape-determining protein MreD [Proteobacteria bacterium]|nr:rod shape-determining protein MreD [Pseudomonadota bacterium]